MSFGSNRCETYDPFRYMNEMRGSTEPDRSDRLTLQATNAVLKLLRYFLTATVSTSLRVTAI